MKKIFLSVMLSSLMLTGCSLQDVNVENKEVSSPVSPTVNSTLDDEPVKTEKIKSENTISDKDIKKNIRPEIGEKFIPEGMVKSGDGYLTVESAEIFIAIL